jgi:uncharacterized Fe-S cluster-containing radical SAM superfamily enzyme
MDLKAFYQKLRKIEQEIADPNVVVVSHETSDGGRAGMKAEVSRSAAARLLLEGRARLATAEEAAEYRESIETARREEEQRSMAQRLQVNLITDAELRAIKNPPRQEKR